MSPTDGLPPLLQVLLPQHHEPAASGSKQCPSISPMYQVILKHIDGKYLAIHVMHNDTIGMLKLHIEAKKRIPQEAQRIIYLGKQPEEGCTVQHTNIRSGVGDFRTSRDSYSSGDGRQSHKLRRTA